MSQANKKSSAQAGARIAQSASAKSSRQAFAAMDSGRESAEKVVKLGSDTMKDFLASGADEAQKAQEKILAFGRESAENMAKSADAMSKFMYEMVAMSRDNIETCIECGNMTASLAKDMSSEAFEAANRTFSEQFEMSKDFFACRTFNDMFELQSRAMRSMMDNYFSQSMRLSNMFFEYSSEAIEPINERVAQASEQLSRAIAA